MWDQNYRSSLPFNLIHTENSGVAVYTLLSDQSTRVTHLRDYHQYASLQSLFLALLYSGTEINDAFVNREWQNRVLELLNAITTNGHEINASITISQRFILYQQAPGKMFSFEVALQKDQILYDLAPDRELDFYRRLQLSSYDNLLKLSLESPTKIPVRDFYSFSTQDDLCNWVLNKIISENPMILCCKHCGKYYFPYKKSQLYCSKACKNQASQISKYGQFDDIPKIVAAIDAFFYRKLDTIPHKDKDKSYDYVYTAPILPSDYDADDLWRIAEIDITQPVPLEEFRKIKTAYEKLNKSHYAEFKDAYDKYHQTEGDNYTEYQGLQKAHCGYYDWLKNIRKQLASFSRDERKVQAYKNKLKRQKASPKT